MVRSKTTSNTGKHGTSLSARFRFYAVEALTQNRDPVRGHLPFAEKIPFDNPRFHRTPSCPHCDEFLCIYRRQRGDEWACCPRCGYATDVSGLVARKLGCTIREAVEFLIFQHNIYNVDESEIERYLVQREKYEWFAAQINGCVLQNYSLSNPRPEHGLNMLAINRLLDTLDLRQYVTESSLPIEISINKPDRYDFPTVDPPGDDLSEPSAAWQSPAHRISNFLGVADYRTVESWFFPDLIDPETKNVRPNTSPNRVFKGTGWNLVLVIPLVDVPGHVCGVLCIGRQGRYPDDYIVRLFREDDSRSTNPGFILPFWSFRTIVMGQRQSGANMILYNNPLHLLRTLFRVCTVVPHIPLIGWIDHFENEPHLKTSNWTPFENVKKIFWTQKHDIRVARTAIEQDAAVVVYDPHNPYPGIKEHKLFERPTFRPNALALENMATDAVHWPRYLAGCFKTMTPESSVDVLRQITLTPQRFGMALARLPRTQHTEAMKRIAKQQILPCNVRVGQYDVFEEAAGLFRKAAKQKSPIFVTDVRCHLDHLFYNSRRTRKLYRGRILYDGQTVGFTVPAMDFERKPISVTREIIKKAGLPEPQFHCKDRFYKGVVFAMSRLKKIAPVRSVGWNGRVQALEFPQFRIKPQRIVPTVDRALLLDDDFPCKYLEPPDVKSQDTLDTPQLFSTLAPFLSMTTLVVLRPFFELKSNPAIISGGVLEMLKSLANSLGVPTMSLMTKTEIKSLPKYNVVHRWPILVPYDVDTDLLKIRGLKSEDYQHTMFYIADTEKVRRITACNSNFAHIPLQSPPNLDDTDWQHQLPIIKHLFFQRLQLHLQQKTIVRSERDFLKSETLYWIGEFAPPPPQSAVSTSGHPIDHKQ